MPLTPVARKRMLRALLDDEMLRLGIGPAEDRENPDSEYRRQRVHFSVAIFERDVTFSNDAEVLFPPQAADAEEPLTHWFLFDGDGQVLAADVLVTPVRLRRDERAKFPPGSVRVDLT